MFNKRYLLILLTFFACFFAMGMNVKAVQTEKECIYIGVDKNGSTFNRTLIRSFDSDDNHIAYYFTNGGGIALYDGSSQNFYTNETVQCPTYVVMFEEDNTSGMQNTHRAYSDKTQYPANYGAPEIEYTLSSTSDGNASADTTYQCKYDMYKRNSDNSWPQTPTTTNVVVTVSSYVQVYEGRPNSSWIEFKFADGVGGTRKPDDKFGLGAYGQTKEQDMDPNECPEYLIPIYFFGGRFVDAYDQNTTPAEIASKSEWLLTRNTSNIYYKKSQTQKDEEAKEPKYEILAKCQYYRGNSSIHLEIGRNTLVEAGASYYVVNAFYQKDIGNDTKLPRKVSDFDDVQIISILENKEKNPNGNPCAEYKYLDVKTNLDWDSIDFDFVTEVADVKKTFKYFSLALDSSSAEEKKRDIDYARGVLYNMLNILTSTTLTNEEKDVQFRQYVAEKAGSGGPEDIQNLAAFLDSGGKISKAIYDYATYWYALASTYANMRVNGENCNAACRDAKADGTTCIDPSMGCENETDNQCINSDCLRFKAQSLVQYIEFNVKYGYIPIPDGCDMLSDDLISFLAWGLRIIRYGALIITIILGMADFVGAIASNDDKAFQKAGGRFFKRLIAVVFIFLSGIFVQFILYNYALPGIGEDEINLCNITNQA